jgi:hypothetical protein
VIFTLVAALCISPPLEKHAGEESQDERGLWGEESFEVFRSMIQLFWHVAPNVSDQLNQSL